MPNREPTLFHPLANCHWRVFLRLYRRHWPYSFRSIPTQMLTWAGVLAQIPGNAIERRIYEDSIREHEFPEPPTFIVGHWRSGTTFLHNVLSRSGRFAFVNLAQTVRPLGAMRFAGAFEKLLGRLVPKQRMADGVDFSPTEPQEEELALALMGSVSAFHSPFFPRDAERNTTRALFLEDLEPGELEAFRENYDLLARKISLIDGGKRPLLFKNPSNTARLDFLRELFPGARFIHIVRHPAEVARSSVRMAEALTRCLSLQPLRETPVMERILTNYARIMPLHLEQRKRIEAGHYTEVRYEDFRQDPMKGVEEIHRAFGWELDDRSRGSIRTYLDSIAGYRPNRRPEDPELMAMIADRLSFAYEQWGYDP